MKNLYLIFTFCLFISGCNNQSSIEKIANLNGYWEIKDVESPHGFTKEYTISPFIDYIELNGKKGFRKKVKPKITGGYFVTDSRENLVVKVENDNINLYYSTPYDSWKETLVSSEENEIVIKNSEGIIYTYKRFTPYLENYGEKKELSNEH